MTTTTAPWTTPTARLRPEVLEGLQDVPRAELARQLGVSTQTLRRYIAGETSPQFPELNRLAEAAGRKVTELVEFDWPHMNGRSCPEWCDDHRLVTVRHRGHPGTLEVLSNEHRRGDVSRGPVSVGVVRYIDEEPLNGPWPRTFLVASAAYDVANKAVSVSIGGLSVTEVRWLAGEGCRADRRRPRRHK
ncbi:MAG: helix-turn-helix transcriptional regulator [Nocardioidaceae bacterium]